MKSSFQPRPVCQSQAAHTAFCTTLPLQHGSQDLLSASSFCHNGFATTNSSKACTPVRRRAHVIAAAHPPRRVGNVAKDLREALQNSLKARTSRIEVRLPFGAKLGTEKRKDDESISSQRAAGDREVARLISGMFEGTGLSVCVAFATDGERNAAKKMWGPLSSCQTTSWATGGAKKKAKQKGTAGFGQPQTKQEQQVNNELEYDVLVATGGGAAFMDKVRKFSDSVGMDKLVIIANPNSIDDVLPVDLDRYFQDEFEPVYIYTPNPSPKWSGGVLFRKFPDDWVFCRLTGVGILQELIKSKDKPSMEEINDVLSREGTSTSNQFMKSFNDLFGMK